MKVILEQDGERLSPSHFEQIKREIEACNKSIQNIVDENNVDACNLAIAEVLKKYSCTLHVIPTFVLDEHGMMRVNQRIAISYKRA